MKRKGTDYFWNQETGKIVERKSEEMKDNVKDRGAALAADEGELLSLLEAGGGRSLTEAQCALSLGWDITRVTWTAARLKRKGLIRVLVMEHYSPRHDS